MSQCVSFSATTFSVNGTSSLSRPVPSTFVKRSGSKLELDGAEFRAVGPNIYWLGLDENINASVSYPSQGRVLEIIATAAAMGATTIRAHTLGVSTGHPLTVQPAFNIFNEEALKAIDWAIFAAKAYGVRLIIPLTDQYDYYHGGKLDFLRFRNLSTSDESLFYTDANVIADFKAYIRTIMNRTNTYTNIRNSEEPTIIAWETGNELEGAPAEWTSDITSYIKSLSSQQLTIDGSYGVQKAALDLDTVDIYSNHFYPMNKYNMRRDAKLVASHNKAYYIGEYDWTAKYTRYGFFGCLIPVIFVIIAFCLPNRWFPWIVKLPSFSRKRRRGKEYVRTSDTSSHHEEPLDPTSEYPPRGEGDEGTSTPIKTWPPHQSDTDLAILPSQSTTSPPRRQRRLVIRKWMFALSFLLLIPFAAWIAIAVGPTDLNTFLRDVERSSAVGSAYWSLFGRDNACCNWVEHNDGFTLHYKQADQLSQSYALTKHAYAMSRTQAVFTLDRKEDLPNVSCPQTNITSV